MKTQLFAFLLLGWLCLPGAPAAASIQWTANPLPFTLAEKMKEFNIKVWRSPQSTTSEIPTTGDIIYVTSNNIKMQCKPLVSEFASYEKMSDQDLIKKLKSVRELKSADDKKSYQKSAEELITQAKEKGYFGSEQHVVYAVTASARTGFRIAPEFFLEADAFGGTAGNGPETTDEGYIGERNSTIAMAHDADWIIGRYFKSGPLAKLHGISPTKQYQIKRMGSFGLMSAGAAQTLNPAGPSWGAEHAINDVIAKELDRLDKPNYNYTVDTWVLKPQQHGWMTSFKPNFMRKGRSMGGNSTWDNKQKKTYVWDGIDPREAQAIDLLGLAQLRAQ